MLVNSSRTGRQRQQEGRGTIVAMLVLVVVAYLSMFLGSVDGEAPTYSAVESLVLVAAGILYCLPVIFEKWLTAVLTARWYALLYPVQIALFAFIGLVGRVEGSWWLLAFLIIGQVAAEYSWQMIAAVSVGILVAVFGVYTYFLGAAGAAIIPLYFSPGIIFVIVFSRIAARERDSRLEVERLAAELRLANHKLSEYAAKIEELATTRERNRMAREIHDSLGHYLTVINVQIEAARAVMESDAARAQDALSKAQKLTQEGLTEVRRSVAALRDSPLGQRPLVELINEMLQELRVHGMEATLTVVGEQRPLDTQLKGTLFRVVQEALTNIRKHAAASEVMVRLDLSTADNLVLTVNDNGQGSETLQGGFGLLGIRERVHLLGGNVEIETAVGHGFHLAVTLPCAAKMPLEA